jgi:hypothetical protein
MAVGLEHRKDPRIVLVYGRRRGRIQPVHPKLVKLTRIPHLIIITTTLVVWVHVLRTQELVVFFLFHILPYDDFELCAEDNAEAIPADGFFDAGDATALTPLIEFAAEGVSFEFEET